MLRRREVLAPTYFACNLYSLFILYILRCGCLDILGVGFLCIKLCEPGLATGCASRVPKKQGLCRSRISADLDLPMQFLFAFVLCC